MFIPKKQKKFRASRKTLVSKLDNVVREIVFLRDPECVTGPYNKQVDPKYHCTNIMSPGHLFSRNSYGTRWHLKNVFKQCTGCNLLHEHDTYAFTKFYIEKFGQEQYDQIHRLYSGVHKFSDFDLEVLHTKLKEEYEKLKGGEETNV